MKGPIRDEPSPTEAVGSVVGAIVPDRAVALPAGYSLSVHGGDADRPQGELQLLAPDGRICLTVVLGPNGPEVKIEAAALSIVSRGRMDLRADELALVTEKDLTLRAGRNLSIEASGHLATSGFSQAIRATHGDVHVEANDDVRVDGERVRLNAPDAAPLRKREGGDDDEPARLMAPDAAPLREKEGGDDGCAS